MSDSTPPAPTFEPVDGIALARLSGPRASLQLAIDEVARLLAAARDAGVQKLALDITGVVGLPSPTLAERHAMVRSWAAAADGRLVVALACPPALIDPERFGVIAAANFGLSANVFDNLADAIAWLRAT